MEESKFDALMTKLQSASWSLSNAISNTKIFSTSINGQGIRLYNVENVPMYINSQRTSLTSSQITTVLSFVNQLIVDFDAEIQAAVDETNQSINTSIDIILE